MTIEIISARYGANGVEVDVADTIRYRYLRNNQINFGICNETMGIDPIQGYEKVLKLHVRYNGKDFHFEEPEGAVVNFPEERYATENCLVLTSCNRVEQICLAIAVNKEIIKENFNLVVADGSTPHLDVYSGINMHQSDDPYNLINQSNYNPNYQLIEDYVKTVPNIKNYRIIHMSPRLDKQTGEANLTAQGLLAAANLGSKYAIKLTGVCNLKYNVFSTLSERMGERAIMTWKRTGFSQRSTRVFAVRPDLYTGMLASEGYYGWIRCYDFIERRFDRLNKKHYNITMYNDLDLDERDIIVDEGIGRNDHREILTENIIKHGLQSSNDHYIRKFLNGGIWQ
jgi:hypothetical protein